MLDSLIYEFVPKDYLHEISTQKWLDYSKAYEQEKNESKRTSFLKALARHSGTPIAQIRLTFNALIAPDIMPADQEKIILALQEPQSLNTMKIAQFLQNHPILKTRQLESLFITRTEWNAFIAKFEQQNRKKVTNSFIIEALCTIRKISRDQLLDGLNTSGPLRSVKRKYIETKPQVRNIRSFYVDDGGINPLIYESTAAEDEVAEKLETEGVRITPLSCATPEKRYPGLELRQTPGGGKVRPVCNIHTGNNRHTLFKHLTPYGKSLGQGRVNVSDVSSDDICKNLSNLLVKRAEPVEYVATLPIIIDRIGVGRQSARSIMGASAADVFRAHEIEISPTGGRSIHWAHLIANFLGDTQDLIVADSTEEIINMVPSTAAANYNTLEAIELFIRKTLVDKKTAQIHIRVTPEYSGEGTIPDLLTYALSWTEKNDMGATLDCHEDFYIFPQSSYRFTKTVHDTIKMLRNERNNSIFAEDEEDDERPTCHL
ncbi:hypothetical protein [Legionella fallonii]|uniref:Uncharacterized protein n=1 Tax=Legionella fallonii LLAP-10 TaxID=1212491 RepID=A0A098G6L5_9GAMM|nr:hypothetical protein [Legionella fallonii]CEG58133.1 protein of unknown function [Legionella fallonii LLAP-10]